MTLVVRRQQSVLLKGLHPSEYNANYFSSGAVAFFSMCDSPTITSSLPTQPVSNDSTISTDSRRPQRKEITGELKLYQGIAEDDISIDRVQDLMSQMNSDQPTGGKDLKYGKRDSQRLRLWESTASSSAPIIVFIHGGSWKSGTYLDSTGSAKVGHLTAEGYAFATINYTLFPLVSVEEQVQEVAESVAFLVQNATEFHLDPERIVLMGHSSGAHVATLLGTDTSYLERSGLPINKIVGVISLDGSNYNAPAEVLDSPGPVADNMIQALGTVPTRLRAMSPTYHAHVPNARAFLLLHVQRQGDIRQAIELAATLTAAGTDVSFHVFEGLGFEGHVEMLLRLGDVTYAATSVMDSWLAHYVPVI